MRATSSAWAACRPARRAPGRLIRDGSTAPPASPAPDRSATPSVGSTGDPRPALIDSGAADVSRPRLTDRAAALATSPHAARRCRGDGCPQVRGAGRRRLRRRGDLVHRPARPDEAPGQRLARRSPHPATAWRSCRRTGRSSSTPTSACRWPAWASRSSTTASRPRS